MNYTTAVFLINKHVRAVKATYEEHDGAGRTVFKTLDDTIKVDDYVIVPTTTRHKMTVCKVVEVDVDVDFDSSENCDWIIARVHMAEHEQVLEQEKDAIAAIKSAELRKKREDLRDAILADHVDDIKALPIADMNGDADQATDPA